MLKVEFKAMNWSSKNVLVTGGCLVHKLPFCIVEGLVQKGAKVGVVVV